MPGLGLSLQDILMGSAMPDDGGYTPPMSEQPAMPKLSKGQMIAGILADALAGAAGQPGQFAHMMNERRQEENQMAQWGLQRRARLEDWQAQQDYQREHPDPSPMERDLAVWSRMTPEQRAAYGQMKQAGAGDPDIFTTLPNGQFYAGPRSGLAAALSGNAAPPKPVGKLTPLDGGPTAPPSGGFRFP